MRPDVTNKLYNLLPEVYRLLDEEQTPKKPLERFLSVLGTGFSELESYIQDFTKLFDFDKVSPNLLDDLADMLGFTFSHTLTEHEKRKFLKYAPYMYKHKGSGVSFEFLARQIYNEGSYVSTTHTSSTTNRKLKIDIVLINETSYTVEKDNNFKSMAEQFRPVNYQLLVNYIFDQAETNSAYSISSTGTIALLSDTGYLSELIVDNVHVLHTGNNPVFIIPDRQHAILANMFNTWSGQTLSITGPIATYS